MKRTLIKIVFATSLSFVATLLSIAQTYNFKNYSTQEGICDPYVYSINQDKDGFIWVGTGEGLCRFDGFNFQSVPDSILSGVVNTSFKDSKGTLWFGINSGEIFYLQDGVINPLPSNDTISSVITSFAEYNQKIYVASQNNGILVIDENLSTKVISGPFENSLINTLNISSEGLLLIGTMDGMKVYQITDDPYLLKELLTINELEYISVQSIAKSNKENCYWIGTDGEGLYLMDFNSSSIRNYRINKVGDEVGLSTQSIQSVLEDKENNLWISTFGNGVFRLINPESNESLKYINYVPENGISHNFIRSIFIDVEGNKWFGTFSNGVDLMQDETFLFYKGSDVTAVVSDEDYYWIASKGNIKKQNIYEKEDIVEYNQSNGLPDDKIMSLYLDEDGKLWIGTQYKGVYTIGKNGRWASKYDLSNVSLGNQINFIEGYQNKIYFATNNGVYILTPQTKSEINLTTRDGLPHNSISHIYFDKEGRGWLATKTNTLYYIKDDKLESGDGLQTERGEIEFKAITQDQTGDIWAGSYRDGLFRFTKDSVYNYRTTSGLKSNFCYSIEVDPNGNIWVGHRQGLSQLNTSNNKINVYEPEHGFNGDCNLNAIAKNKDGLLYIGTTDGLISYNFKQDKVNNTPPMLNILSAYLNDEPIDLKNGLSLKYGAYKLRIDFIGLNYQAPEGVVYQYMLEGQGFDQEFGEPTHVNTETYNNLRDGEYSFVLRAFNQDGIYNDEPLTIKIDIKKPFWKTLWFFITSFVIIIFVFFVIIKYRESKQKQLQEYLENQLAIRTKEVIAQKNEIELKNRDITDSINYAQRIQASILPSIRRLQDHFSGSFVFYKPRDIVSGDFYWFDIVKDEKFVIVCADSTGHGVPGAFMSMIGTTLIKDICMRSDVNSPSEILFMLDNELKNTLNQNLEAERSNDGMDIIVCEVDLTNRFVRFASAMRPLIIYKDGEEIYLKGSRSSVGGHMQKEDKDFEEQGFQLNKGDIIYMFSDGYPDQFGGPLGKKFKMVRLRNMLRDMHQKPMELQYETVKNTFREWKHGEEQVDDVLFMGLKI